jgi:divalent metal cation (Fe/Co/Zn/Cd) transporter
LSRGISHIYKLGRELGLAKKDIDKVFAYNSFKGKDIGGIIVILVILFIGFLIILASLTAIPNSPYVPSNNTYKTGTLYSTVKIKDFQRKKIKSTIMP